MVYFDQILLTCTYTFLHCLATGVQNGDETWPKISTAAPAPRETLCTGFLARSDKGFI